MKGVFHLIAAVVVCASAISAASTVELTIMVDPGTTTLHAARDQVRHHLTAAQATNPPTIPNITVKLLPGVHNVGGTPLILGPEDGGLSPDAPVTWESADPSSPAVVGAPIPVTVRFSGL
jgi:hypothetical protein